MAKDHRASSQKAVSAGLSNGRLPQRSLTPSPRAAIQLRPAGAPQRQPIRPANTQVRPGTQGRPAVVQPKQARSGPPPARQALRHELSRPIVSPAVLSPGVAQRQIQMRPGVLSKCGCQQATVPSSRACGCHGGYGVTAGLQVNAIQLAKKKKAKPPKVAAWLKTWRNIKCYANATAAAMEKRMSIDAIEAYIKRFISEEHRDGVRGHCSDGSGNPGNQSQHTTDDLVVFHSFKRRNPAW
jgi:hypothetical protein